MPIIKSAIKRNRQNKKKQIRNHAEVSEMRSAYKNIIKWISSGEIEKAEKFFPIAQKKIDTCAKKKLIHKNNAARKKSRIAKNINLVKK